MADAFAAPLVSQVQLRGALRSEKGAFMHSSKLRRSLVPTLAGLVVLALAGSALGAAQGPTKASILIKGGETFKPNAYIQDNLHFEKGTVIVRSGATVTLTNTTRDPHTLSIVNRSQLPRTIAQVEHCVVCGAIAKSHGVNPEAPPSGPPSIPLVNVGAPGFNAPGDSIFVGPKGPGGRVTFKVTARPGTVLYFMCAVHPWMQGRFLVK